MYNARLHKFIVSGIYIGNIAGLSLFWFFAIAIHQRLTAANIITNIGRLSGLLAVIFILAELLMMARVPLIEKAYSLDELTRIHRINGYLTFSFLVLHAIAITVGYQLISRLSFVSQFLNLTFNYEDVLKSVLGFALFMMVTFSSIKLARSKVSYEVWYFVHLLAYLAVLLAFGHQLKIGADFIGRPLFVLYWYALYVITAVLIGWYRFAIPLLSVWRYGLKVVEVKPETHNTYTVRLAGKGLANFKYQPGQFAVWYFLAPKFWWQGHPFSISSNYGDHTLDVTIKASGDYTKLLSKIKVGTPVLVDGPHGKFTLSKTNRKKLLMIAGGVGITPILSILGEISKSGDYDVLLLNGCKNSDEIIFKNELQNINNRHGTKIDYLFSEQPGKEPQFIDSEYLQNITDLLERAVFLCGPIPMMNAVTSNLIDLGVSKKDIHSERFDY